ncbi:MAG: phenylalanine--tRNA ligase subunit beta [Dehalococcoidia bacterium]
MRISLKWLADYVDVTLPPKELGHRLTMAGLEVETIHYVGGDWDEKLVMVGEVVSVDPHPNADRLRLATVDLGESERMTVVCGAPNVAPGQKIAFARAGASLIDGKSGKLALLKPATIRGVESAGMVCSERELGLSEEHEGILVLPDDAPVGRPLARYLGDAILDIDLKPNRPDCLSMVGIAREVAALTGQTLREPEHTYAEEDEPAAAKTAVEIADPDLCLRYVATVIEDVHVGESPPWMQERLIAAGMRPINNIVDITNYVMLEVGQPLHAFDYTKLRGGRIVVRRARVGEKMTTLDDIERTLTNDMLVIADAELPVAIAGVMGGSDSEVTPQTTTVLLESANFHPTNVRRTATKLKSRTEASSRFEKGLSPALALIGAMRATKLFVELTGARALHGFVDVYPAPARDVHIDLTRARLEQVLGIDLATSQVRSALTSLGFGCQWHPPERYEVRVPSWRTDVLIAEDVIEEVARVVGYEHIPTKGLGGEVPPRVPQPLRDLRERLRDALAAAGMQEVISYSLTTMAALRQVMPPEELATYPPLRVVSPVSQEHEYLRPVLRASLLKTLAANVRQREGELALFEVAKGFTPQPDALPEEHEHVVGVVTGRREDRWGHATQEPIDFYDAKGYVEAALDSLAITATFESVPAFGLVPGRAAELHVDGRKVGTIGQVHPSVAEAFDIDQDVYLFELLVDELLPSVGGIRRYEPPSRFPPVVQDVALLVDQATPADRVRALIEEHKLVREARIFDVYEGDRIPPNKKSLAFAVTYQSSEGTLTDEEVARARRAIVERLQREVSAELRGAD